MNEENIDIKQPENTTAHLETRSYEKNGWYLTRYTWSGASPEELDYRVGDRIWPAGEDEKASFVVKAIKKPGEKYFPDGGVVCTSAGADRSFSLDAVIKHPKLIEEENKRKKKRKA